ncbi:unnamed protein product [Durusdinium trenchii]|uniref:Uncharacterized protein n=1 Tax=Durusdinium trenchii TaxID=1381693 RepID=A0ABP0QRB4_9DINO
MDDHGDIKSTVASAIPAQYRMRPWLKDWPLFCALWVAGYEFFKAGSDCSQAVDIRSLVAGMQESSETTPKVPRQWRLRLTASLHAGRARQLWALRIRRLGGFLVLRGTQRWISELVVASPASPGLCPWAARAQQRLVHGRWGQVEASEAVRRLRRVEGERLRNTSAAWPTTLVVFSHPDFAGPAGLVTFSQLWRDVAKSQQEDLDLLAFHPCREDRGPGCRAHPRDAGHFSVRAPWPTLQLLRASDLYAARAEWLRRGEPGPGALSLLLQNKARLRAEGSYGALGIGSWADCHTPTEVWFPEDDAEAHRRLTFVYQVAAGTKHSVALTDKGQVYTWGHGGHGRLGLGQAKVRGQNSYSAEFVPRQVSNLHGVKVTYIAAGEAHTAAVDQLGGLFTWGQGSYGRCGHGVGTDMPSPARVESLSGLSMSQVALGLMHSVTKSVKGQLYSWGKGPATGFDVADVITTPRQVKLDLRDPVYQIAAGPLHTVVLMQNGSVIYFGSGTEGRLPYRNNLDGSLEDVPAPTLLKPPELKVKGWAQEKNTKTWQRNREASWWPSRLCCGSSSSAVLTGGRMVSAIAVWCTATAVARAARCVAARARHAIRLWAALLRVLLLQLQCRIAWLALVALVIEGDTYVDVYHNGAYVAADISTSLIPLNGVRRVVASDTPAKVMVFPLGLDKGDVLAFRLITSRPELVNVSNALGQNTEYPAPLGMIMASRNGMLSTSDLKCSTQEKENNDERTPFFFREFNDTLWKPAYEQPSNCCPWRDPQEVWYRMNAKWIGANPVDFGNMSGPRQLNCRYHVPGDTVVGNLPAAETANAGDVNDTAPLLNVTALEISTSVTKILFNVEREANIYCGVIDARYELRVPTHLELKSWGESAMNVKGQLWAMALIGSEFSASELNATVLQRVQVNTLEDCEARCIARDLCVAMEFYVVGQDVISGTNCKLLQDEYDTNNRFPESPIASFTQKYKYLAKPEHTITISGLLFPNTVYNTYCSAEDPVTLVHSNWSAIGRTYQTARTGGCFNCGNEIPPEIFVWGGFVGARTLGLVASASQPGRIFCNAFEVNASQAPTISGELIREPNIFAILTSTGASISLTLGNLLPETEYHVACMAESDGGTESVLQQMEATRRSLTTEKEDSTISSMRIVRDRLMFWDEITVSTQLISIGYLWCQVFPTENIRELGLPTAESLKEGDNLKVADLQELSSVTFSELDPNTSYDVWCTSEYNDFRDDQAGQDLLTPFPKSTVLSIDSSYYTADVLVYLTKGPADVYCQAYPWALRPFTERPAIPTATMLKTSPFRTTYFNTPSGMVMIFLENLVPGRYYDVYCFSETHVPADATGADTVAQFGMDPPSILETRTQLLTQGPFFDDLGWSCVSGRNVSDLLGVGLSKHDGLFVRADGCPERCRCSGVADPLSHADERTDELSRMLGPLSKGAECTPISQDVTVQAGVGLSDAKDLRYVAPGACRDEEVSQATRRDVTDHPPVCPVFDERTLPRRRTSGLWWGVGGLTHDRPRGTPEWKVCSYLLEAGSGTVVSGFPNGGLSQTFDGRSFSWGDGPVVAVGRTYDLCWCNGTASSCTLEADFSVRLGPLHFGGPSTEQARPKSVRPPPVVRGAFLFKAVLPPILGIFPAFAGETLLEFGVMLHSFKPASAESGGLQGWYALCDFGNGSRLVVLPLDPRGCLWQRVSQADSPGLTDFPNLGVSETFDEITRSYHFFGVPLIARGGRYNICWCGPPPVGITKVPGKDYRQPDGLEKGTGPVNRFTLALPEARIICPSPMGATSSPPAGVLQLLGPSGQPETICLLKFWLRLRSEVNLDSRDDAGVVPQVIGEGLQGSDRVAALQQCGQPANPPLGWQQGAEALGTDRWTSAGWLSRGPSLSHEMLQSFGAPGVEAAEGVNASDRGIYGFPNMGISVPSSIVGHVTWGGSSLGIRWLLPALLVWNETTTLDVGRCQLAPCFHALKPVQDVKRSAILEENASFSDKVDFLVPFGHLILNGPAVLPLAAQEFRCVRVRQCEIADFQGAAGSLGGGVAGGERR